MKKFSVLLSLFLVINTGTYIKPAESKESKSRVVVISLDGGGEKIISSAIKKGLMPNLERIMKEGTHAAGSIPNFPSKTAPGHASLWTGTYGYKNGVTSNSVFKLPLSEHTILETENGFDSRALQVEPIWVTAAKQNKHVLITQATHTYPATPYFSEKRFGIDCKDNLTIFDGYGDIKSKDELITEKTSPLTTPQNWTVNMPQSSKAIKEISFKILDKTFYGLVYDDPKNTINGYDTVAMSFDKKNFVEYIDASKFSKTVFLDNKTTEINPKVYFRLFNLDSENGNFMLYHTEISQEILSNDEFVKKHNNDVPAFIGHGAAEIYERGYLGKTVIDGGNGTAEERLLETIKFSIDSFKNRADYAMNNFFNWDLLINYLPFPDGMLHIWYGALDTNSPDYDPELAKKLTPYADRVFTMVDSYVGLFLNKLPSDNTIAIVSDHGMMGTSKIFYPNNILKNAGLLATDASGKIDLSKSKIVYPPTDGAFLAINKVSRKGGIVNPEEESEVLEQATKALLEAKDPQTGKQIVNKVFNVNEFGKSLKIGPEYGGDLYIDLAYSYYFSSRFNNDIVAKPPFKTSGSHIYFPYREAMHAIFFIKGKDIKKNNQIDYVKTIDVAPTISKILGIKPSNSSEGMIIENAFK